MYLYMWIYMNKTLEIYKEEILKNPEKEQELTKKPLQTIIKKKIVLIKFYLKNP